MITSCVVVPRLPLMPTTCERCSALRAEMETARVEAAAILQDRSERARVGEAPRTPQIELYKQAKQRWDAAVSEFAAHRAEHFDRQRHGS